MSKRDHQNELLFSPTALSPWDVFSDIWQHLPQSELTEENVPPKDQPDDAETRQQGWLESFSSTKMGFVVVHGIVGIVTYAAAKFVYQ